MPSVWMLRVAQENGSGQVTVSCDDASIPPNDRRRCRPNLRRRDLFYRILCAAVSAMRYCRIGSLLLRSVKDVTRESFRRCEVQLSCGYRQGQTIFLHLYSRASSS